MIHQVGGWPRHLRRVVFHLHVCLQQWTVWNLQWSLCDGKILLDGTFWQQQMCHQQIFSTEWEGWVQCWGLLSQTLPYINLQWWGLMETPWLLPLTVHSIDLWTQNRYSWDNIPTDWWCVLYSLMFWISGSYHSLVYSWWCILLVVLALMWIMPLCHKKWWSHLEAAWHLWFVLWSPWYFSDGVLSSPPRVWEWLPVPLMYCSWLYLCWTLWALMVYP